MLLMVLVCLFLMFLLKVIIMCRLWLCSIRLMVCRMGV